MRGCKVVETSFAALFSSHSGALGAKSFYGSSDHRGLKSLLNEADMKSLLARINLNAYTFFLDSFNWVGTSTVRVVTQQRKRRKREKRKDEKDEKNKTKWEKKNPLYPGSDIRVKNEKRKKKQKFKYPMEISTPFALRSLLPRENRDRAICSP